MKRLFILLVLLCAAATLFAQVALPEHQFASGRWGFVGSRLNQSDATARLAKVNIRAPQSGPMEYLFNVKYVDGLQDGHGGFGIHIFADRAYNGPSWGVGISYLLWLNYDENPVTPGFIKGFSAQVYRSRTNSIMDLVYSYDLNQYLPYITWDDLNSFVPVKIWANGNTGEVRVYDPTDPDLTYYWYFYLDSKDLPLRGDWVALRTNGINLSFGMGL